MRPQGLRRFNIWIIQPLPVDFEVIWSPATDEMEMEGSHLHIKQTLQKQSKTVKYCD